MAIPRIIHASFCRPGHHFYRFYLAASVILELFNAGWRLLKEEFMKKWIILFLTIVGFGSFASAQQFTIKLGAALSFGNSVGFGANLGIRTPSLLKFSKTLGVGIRVDVATDFSSGFSGFAALSPVLNIELDKNTLIYLGPTVGLAFGGLDPLFIFGADLGFKYAISPFIGVYADTKFLFVPIFFAVFDLGANYNLSKELSIYLEFQGGLNPVGFSPGIGLGLFIRL
jgi:hypothetical protein